MRLYSTVFLAAAALAAGLFWQLFGHSLHYHVFAGEVVIHTENFSPAVRMGVTVAAGAGVAGLCTWLVYAWCQDYVRK